VGCIADGQQSRIVSVIMYRPTTSVCCGAIAVVQHAQLGHQATLSTLCKPAVGISTCLITCTSFEASTSSLTLIPGTSCNTP
jgi:hypothetical protein